MTLDKNDTEAKYEWYALYTKPRFEKRIKERLESNGYESYLPLHRTPRVWSDRIKMVDIPLFNSYIFVKCREFEILSLLRINGIVRVVFYNGKPAVIRQVEIDAIQAFLKEAEGRVLCAGDDVEILAGSMKSKSGKIVMIKKKYLVLRVEQLTATVCVKMDNVVPLKRLK